MSKTESLHLQLDLLNSASMGEGFELNSLPLIHSSVKQSDSKSRDRLIYIHPELWIHYKCAVASPLTRIEGTNMTNALEIGDDYDC